MPYQRIDKPHQKSRGWSTQKKTVVFTATLLAIFLPAPLLAWRVHTSHLLLVPLRFLPLLAGIMFEYHRISEKWSRVLGSALGAFAASYLAFLPWKHESVYVLEDHIEVWPYLFC